MTKNIAIDVVGKETVVKIDGLILAVFDSHADAETRKKELEDAILLDESGKMPPSTLRHRTGWVYSGQMSLPPELFVGDDEDEKDFLSKVGTLEGKLIIAEFG